MRSFRHFLTLLFVALMCTVPAAHAQQGQFHLKKSTAKAGGFHTDSEPPQGQVKIFIMRVAAAPNAFATSIVDCNADNPGIMPDGSTGDCYVSTDPNGFFNLTDAYSCVNDTDIIYFEAVGGTVNGNENDQVALMDLPSSAHNCGYYFNNSSTAFIYISDFSNVAAAFGAGAFATVKHTASHSYDSIGVYNSNADHAALMKAFDYVNSIVPDDGGNYSGSDSNVTLQLNTLADVAGYCINSSGGTASGTPCGTLFANTTQGSFVTGTNQAPPDNTWTALVSIAEDPYTSVTNQYNLIAMNPAIPWTPYDSAAPTQTFTNPNQMWTVPVLESGQPSIDPSLTPASATHSVTGTTRTLIVRGTNLVDGTGACPTVVVAGYVASGATNCSSTSVTVNVPKFTSKGSLAVYVGQSPAVASTMIPFTIN